MKLQKIVEWLDRTLNVAAFDDVSNNGVQIDRVESPDGDVSTVAFAVDASVRAIKAAADAGAQLLVVHHGISWGGGIRRVTGGIFEVIRAARDANIAVYGVHLPLDAHPTLGNNARLAKIFKLTQVRPAFSYHGHLIGCVGVQRSADHSSLRIGICSGGAGEFAADAKRLGCDLFVTGEASWGDVIAAENVGMKMTCLGHYETEVHGVRALAGEMKKRLRISTADLTETLKIEDK